MTPIPLTLEDVTALAPLPCERVTYRGDAGVAPLPAIRFYADVQGHIVTRWTFTDTERAALAAGADLYLTTRTFHEPLQPIRPTIGVADLLRA